MVAAVSPLMCGASLIALDFPGSYPLSGVLVDVQSKALAIVRSDREH
jgi:hypothetical protein